MLRMNYEICPKRRINTKQGCLNHFVLRCGWCWPFYLQCYSRKWSLKGTSYQTSQRHFLPEKERCHISHLPTYPGKFGSNHRTQTCQPWYRDISVIYSSLRRGTFQPANLPTFGGDIAETFGASAGEQTKAGLGIPKKFMGQRENLSKDPFEHGIFEGYLWIYVSGGVSSFRYPYDIYDADALNILTRMPVQF